MKPRANHKAAVLALTAQIADLQTKFAGEEALLGRIKILEGDNKALEDRLAGANAAKEQLKTLLGDAYDQIAAQRGYIDRALEDDAVREVGPTRDEPVNAMPKQPRRAGPQPMMMRVFDNPNGEYDGRAYRAATVERRAPRAWHSL